jgi:hypothetical protein
MNAPLRLPVIPAADAQQETMHCDRFGGPCCEWACCKAPVKFPAPTQSQQTAVLDIEAMAELDATLGSQEFFAQWHDASNRKEAEYLNGDRTSHRRAWEA